MGAYASRNAIIKERIMFKRLFRGLFGGIKDGRIGRAGFFWNSVLVIALAVIFAITLIILVEVGEQIVGGDMASAQKKIEESSSLPGMIVTAVFTALLMFAQVNLAAKRVRDMGLPGWWVVTAAALVGLILSQTLPDQTASGVNAAVWLALLLVPSGVFELKKDVLEKPGDSSSAEPGDDKPD